MEHPTLTLIIRFPNETLKIGSQEKLKGKVIHRCPSCKLATVTAASQKSLACPKCSYQITAETAKGVNCSQPGCCGVMSLLRLPSGKVMSECNICDSHYLLG